MSQIKKATAILLVLFLIFGLSACTIPSPADSSYIPSGDTLNENSQSDESDENSEESTNDSEKDSDEPFEEPIDNPDPSEYIDRTVEAETFTFDDTADIFEVESRSSFENVYSDIESLTNAAGSVVVGIVLDIKYFDLSGTGNIIYSFAIDKVLRGGQQEKTIISVITIGGYARLSRHVEIFGNRDKWASYTDEQINSTILKYCNNHTDDPAVGDSCVLFLANPIKDELPFPDGVYSELCSFQGRLVKQEDGRYARVIPLNEPDYYGNVPTVFTPEEIETEVKAAGPNKSKV